MGSNTRHPVASEPPSRWDHETLRAAAQRPISGPGATDTLSALGGPSTLTTRKPGAMGGRFSGADTPPIETSRVMVEATIPDREVEGGGGA
jgi:hypothetical protein